MRFPEIHDRIGKKLGVDSSTVEFVISSLWLAVKKEMSTTENLIILLNKFGSFKINKRRLRFMIKGKLNKLKVDRNNEGLKEEFRKLWKLKQLHLQYKRKYE